MAIDTREERQAVASVSFGYYNPTVTPNASMDDEWRQQVAHSFSGIGSDPPAPFIYQHNNPNLRHNMATYEHNDPTLEHLDEDLEHMQ